MHSHLFTAFALGAAALLPATLAHAEPDTRLAAQVDDIIRPLMAEYRIPGMAVGLSVDGEQHLFYYGLADLEASRAVDERTLFELGSISKLYTATLAAYAETQDVFALDDAASRHLAALAGSAFDDISLLELATYTAGGLPLQFPETLEGDEAMLEYFRDWRPDFAPGTHRLYSNPSIGLLGYITAERLAQPFDEAMAEHVFAPLGIEHSFFEVPADEREHYAYGYSPSDAPLRVNPGLLDAQAYGLKATASDVLRFLEAHRAGAPTAPLQAAMNTTQAGYFTLGDMAQGLGWERYAAPAALEQLTAGSALEVVLEPNAVERMAPPLPPSTAGWLHKTGATNGFGSYVAIAPDERISVVLLANRNYPNAARIEAAYRLVERMRAAW